MATGMTKTALIRHMAEKLQITNKQPPPAWSCWRRPLSRRPRRMASCNPRHRPPGKGRAQGPHGPQPADRPGHQDQGQDRGQIPRGQVRQGRDRAPEEVVFFPRTARSEPEKGSLVLSLFLPVLENGEPDYAALFPPFVLLLANPRTTREIPKLIRTALIELVVVGPRKKSQCDEDADRQLPQRRTAASHCGCAAEAGRPDRRPGRQPRHRSQNTRH